MRSRRDPLPAGDDPPRPADDATRQRTIREAIGRTLRLLVALALLTVLLVMLLHGLNLA